MTTKYEQAEKLDLVKYKPIAFEHLLHVLAGSGG